ncbi:TetR/AcrR family transcriptional regulator [Streptomyces sp. P01-B04]|uniref:TetR/AcrR family transcriptional regulator n=1 Tax=Streptomyces poriferorum TaxID=2798799 RepID=UPI001C5DAF6C|nr:TetR/AcrR family transcriptional regulator [Streptomyces poriferorum]MBW5250593.1 TetR/AcrR family transcriptional regulator [Streptomyces poriferorum]MBW5255711.1 TetR/AcrR family transcriptional regulator [Streptomyces poriferorum]
MAETHTDGRIARGNQTRQLVLKRAVEIASVEGLEGLSLGRLSTELKLSKSGVFALFGSKEDLQLATVRAAIKVYLEHVVQPARDLPPGLDRLWQVCTGWLDYSRRRVFPGGCFFYSVTAEYDAREGKVHDTLASARANWFTFVEQTVGEAQQSGEVEKEADAAQLTFELVALMEMANAESVLHNEFTCYDKASKGILNRLRAVATDASMLPAS